MRTSWLVCALLGTLAWGQLAPSTPPQPAPAADPAASVPADAIVLTVIGVCAPHAATKPPAAKTGATEAAPAKEPAAAKPAECKTTYTKAQFEKLASGLSPNVTPQFRKQLSTALPKFIAMSDQAKKKGLDKTSRYESTLQFVKMQILANELQRSIQEEAAKVPPAQIESYYKENPEAFEQYNLERLFVPRAKQEPVDAKEEDPKEEKLTEEQQKAKEAEEKAKNDAAEQAMTQLAQKLHDRAVAGEDFIKLQKEAFEAAGMKIESPTVNLTKVRRTGLPPAHAAVFELKPGEISQVINDSGGHYIYKVDNKETQPLDQVKDEIHSTLQNQRSREMMEKVNNSYKAEPNEAYFGPPGPAGIPPGRMPNPRMPQSPMAPHPATAPPAQPPAEKPN